MKRPFVPVVLLAATAVATLAGCDRAPQAAPEPNAASATRGLDSTAPAAPLTATEAATPPDTAPDPFDLTTLEPDGVHTPSPPVGVQPDVVFVPTPHDVVDEMLRIAGVGPDDVLYDLGSGDGRIPITAARRWGTRGVGIDIDPQRIREAKLAAEAAGVTDKVGFIEGDLFEADLAEATVITLYLLPDLNLRLRPTLLKLRPGTRIVSHNYHMGDWEPEQHSTVGDAHVYGWTVPETTPAHLRDGH